MNNIYYYILQKEMYVLHLFWNVFKKSGLTLISWSQVHAPLFTSEATMLINLHDLKSRPTKAINIEQISVMTSVIIIYMELTFPWLLIFFLNNQHKRFISMGNRYTSPTNLVWDQCDWVWHTTCLLQNTNHINENRFTKAMPIAIELVKWICWSSNYSVFWGLLW